MTGADQWLLPTHSGHSKGRPGLLASVGPLSHRACSDATMNIEGWLRSLGLEQYEAAFRENKIDREVLPQLTAEDLKDIGVTIVGDRRKMLTAIGELSASSAAPTPTAQPTTPAPAPLATDGA